MLDGRRWAVTPLLSATDIVKTYRGASFARSDLTRALSGVSLSLAAGEVLGVVGESGSGKTTLIRVLGLVEPPSSGVVTYRGAEAGRDKAGLRLFRREVQIVPQDSAGALNPRMQVLDALLEPMRANPTAVLPEHRLRRAQEVLDLVQLSSRLLQRYPHELSGGQRQRVCMSRALTLHPSVLLCDEPFSALDVSIQAQAVNVLKDLQDALDLAVVFVSHDLSIVRQIADRVMVLHGGRVVEEGAASAVLLRPSHEYSKRLVSAMLELERGIEHIGTQ